MVSVLCLMQSRVHSYCTSSDLGGWASRQMARVESVTYHTCRENIVLSLRPSLHSGMPDKYAFICSVPLSSEWTTTPLLLTIKLNCSMQSRNTCKQELQALHYACIK